MPGYFIICPAIDATLFGQTQHCQQPDVDGRAGSVYAADRLGAAGAVASLHGGRHRLDVSVFVAHLRDHPAGSRVLLFPGVYFGRAGRQRGVAGRDPLAVLLLVLVYGVLFTAVYWMEKRRSTQPTKLHISPLGMLTAVIMAITVFAVSNLSFVNNNEATMSIRYIRTLVDLAGVLILTVQHEQLRESALHSELTAMDDVLRRQYEQYRQSKENIKLINRRYHELKVQIATIRAERDQAKQDAALAAMESDIRRYEAENKTGNPVLDTLLTAKSLYCQQHGINMTCVADGKLLDFLSTGEICTIVGTALDNATESVAAEPDPEKKLIRVAIYAQNGFVMLRFENYCAQPVELGPDGLPLRSAHGGYDLKSVRAAAEAHGGTLTLHWENEWFTLRVLLPQK